MIPLLNVSFPQNRKFSEPEAIYYLAIAHRDRERVTVNSLATRFGWGRKATKTLLERHGFIVSKRKILYGEQVWGKVGENQAKVNPLKIKVFPSFGSETGTRQEQNRSEKCKRVQKTLYGISDSLSHEIADNDHTGEVTLYLQCISGGIRGARLGGDRKIV